MHLFNPWNDLALANFSPNYTPPASAVRMAEELAILPIWYAGEDTGIAGDIRGITGENAGIVGDNRGITGEDIGIIGEDVRSAGESFGNDVRNAPGTTDSRSAATDDPGTTYPDTTVAEIDAREKEEIIVIAAGELNRSFPDAVKKLLPVEVSLIPFSGISSYPCRKIIPWGWNPALRRKLLLHGAEEGMLPSLEELTRLRSYSNRQHAVEILRELHTEAERFCLKERLCEADHFNTEDRFRVKEVKDLLGMEERRFVADCFRAEGRFDGEDRFSGEDRFNVGGQLNRKSLFCGESRFCTDTEELYAYLHAISGDKVLKMPLSGSGKGLIWILGGITDKQRDWCRRVIREQGGVVAEPVLHKVQDFAMEFYLHRGEVRFAGYSMFSAAPSGAYTGNELISDSRIEEKLSQYAPVGLLRQLRNSLAEKLSGRFPHYSGYAGVDMMVCATPYGWRIHPCVEINLRMNMGMVARIFHGRYMHSGTEGKFVVDYFKKPGSALSFHEKMQRESPLIVENGKILSGYLSLTPVAADTRYTAYIVAG